MNSEFSLARYCTALTPIRRNCTVRTPVSVTPDAAATALPSTGSPANGVAAPTLPVKPAAMTSASALPHQLEAASKVAPPCCTALAVVLLRMTDWWRWIVAESIARKPFSLNAK